MSATFPLCVECNSEFGRDLESPISKLFDEIENGQGLNDIEAELIIRWLWKIQGLAWIANHPTGKHTLKYTLRERVLFPIDEVRSQLVLGMALFGKLHPESTDLPMGLDSSNQVDAIFVSGVFSKIAILVVRDIFQSMIPNKFGSYRLASKRDSLSTGKLFYPPSSFHDELEAVGETWMASVPLSEAHDQLAIKLQSSG